MRGVSATKRIPNWSWLCWHPELRLPVPRTVRKQMFKPPGPWSFVTAAWADTSGPQTSLFPGQTSCSLGFPRNVDCSFIFSTSDPLRDPYVAQMRGAGEYQGSIVTGGTIQDGLSPFLHVSCQVGRHLASLSTSDPCLDKTSNPHAQPWLPWGLNSQLSPVRYLAWVILLLVSTGLPDLL